MNSHEAPREALDEDEREFARIVRALPGGDPPPALDARILRAAQDAVAAAPARRRRPLLALGSAWGISSTAAAVLALGVGWQLLNPPGRGLPASDDSPVPVATETSQEQRTEVDFIRRELPETPPPPPSEQGIAAMPKSAAPASIPAAPAASKPTADFAGATATQEAFMDEHVDTVHRDLAAAAAQPRHDAASKQAERRQSQELGLMTGNDAQRQVAGAAAAAPPAPALAVVGEPSRQQQSETMDRVEVTGSRLARASDKERTRATTSTASDRQRVLRAGDDVLSREAWIERMRARLRNGDASGAHASLLLYLERYPGIESLPADLRRLLQK